MSLENYLSGLKQGRGKTAYLIINILSCWLSKSEDFFFFKLQNRFRFKDRRKSVDLTSRVDLNVFSHKPKRI